MSKMITAIFFGIISWFMRTKIKNNRNKFKKKASEISEAFKMFCERDIYSSKKSIKPPIKYSSIPDVKSLKSSSGIFVCANSKDVPFLSG